MAKKKESVHKDFELFEAIFKEAENNAEEDELFFQVSPVRKPAKDENEKLTATTELDGKNTSDKKEIKLSKSSTETDEDFDPVSEISKDSKPQDDESHQSDNISEIDMEVNNKKPDVVESEEDSSEMITWSDSSEEEEKHKNENHVKFIDMMKDNEQKPKKTLSLSVDYDSFRELIENSKKSTKKDSPKSNGNHKDCQCPNCPANRYKSSSFPLFSQLVNDDEDDDGEQQVKKKQKVKKKKKKKKKQKQEDIMSSRKAKLDARLSNSGNPTLLMWLAEKNKLEKQKRQRERKEKKMRKGESKADYVNEKSLEEKRQEKLNEWVERKKKEMREEKQKRLSSHLETNQKKPVIPNQRPKTAVRTPKVYMKPAVESKDILGPPKQRPQSSPVKSVKRSMRTEEKANDAPKTMVSKEPNDHNATNDVHEVNLKDETHQTSYTSIAMFINTIVESAIEELDRQNRIKESRLRQRPKTSRASRQNGVVWKDHDELSARSQTRPFSSAVTRQQTNEIQSGIKPSMLKLKRPATSLPRRIRKNTLVENENVKNRHIAWLEEKQKQEKIKKELKRREKHYEKLEATLVEEEQERRRKEMEETTQRLNTGLRRERETKEKVEHYQITNMIRSESQSSESYSKKTYSDSRSSSSASTLPEIRHGTPIIGFTDDVNNIPIFGTG